MGSLPPGATSPRGAGRLSCPRITIIIVIHTTTIMNTTITKVNNIIIAVIVITIPNVITSSIIVRACPRRRGCRRPPRPGRYPHLLGGTTSKQRP